MDLPVRTDTVVIGAGHSGLAMSRLLSLGGRDHVVLERRPTLGGGWQDRWDAFRLVSPNWTTSFPGQPYDGPEPDAFMPRDDIVATVRRYADTVRAPVVTEAHVSRLAPRPGGTGFLLETNQGPLEAERVVVATGGFHRPNIPAIAAALPERLTAVHSFHYRREADLPPGAVLVVGSAQTGCQLAEELQDAGREVYLSAGARVDSRAGTVAATSSAGSVGSRPVARRWGRACRHRTSCRAPRRGSVATPRSRATRAATAPTCGRWPSRGSGSSAASNVSRARR